MNAKVTKLLCCNIALLEGEHPLTTAEWSKLASVLMQNKLAPKHLLEMEKKELENLFSHTIADRIEKLLNREIRLFNAIDYYEKQGIKIITRAEENYPSNIKAKLSKNSPPLFYYLGNISLLKKELIGVVGSRNANDDDISFAGRITKNALNKGYGIVSGGARGIDSVARDVCLENDGEIAEYIVGSLVDRLSNMEVQAGIKRGKMLLLSSSSPIEEFSAREAMIRNSYIYAESKATIVVKCDYKKGGSWNGAINAIKKNYVPVFVWGNEGYVGNIELSKNGAMPIDSYFDFNIQEYEQTKLG